MNQPGSMSLDFTPSKVLSRHVTLSQGQVGKLMSISKFRVCQLENQALSKLREGILCDPVLMTMAREERFLVPEGDQA